MAVLCSGWAIALSGWGQGGATGSPGAKKERARIVLSKPLPPMDGEHLKATLVEVNYGPGEFSLPHSHPCPVLVYVVEGAVRTQVNGGPEAIYKAGETFYEGPNGVHQVSANASRTAPARFIAFFVCDHDAPLSSEPPHGTPGKH
jgi:quercetin dioxygenase-like cupin family protein